MLVTFWGVRGSIAISEATHLRVGGNTSCVGVSIDGYEFLFDSGTGIRRAGRALSAVGCRRYTVMLSHTHHDHINGFPFFTPVYIPGTDIRVLAGHMNGRGGIRQIFDEQMSDPLFPIPLAGLKANIGFEDFLPGNAFEVGPGIMLRTAQLNHPGGATGYRLEHKGKSVCYVTDTEHTPGTLDQNILGLIEGADLFIYDSTYTDDEYEAHRGWGHSTWQEGVRLSQAAGVHRYVVFHHDPDHDDIFLEAVEMAARERFEGTMLGRDGLRIHI